ncbi:hypothetical protein GOODEAATRI_033380, partial [Goodea atripinnis]
MASVGTIRLCLACNTGYIMTYDLHAICEGCLGPDHASLALTPQSTCPSCRRLPQEEKQRRLAIFSPLEGEFPIADQCFLEEALDIFGPGRESDDSAPETATDISTPFLRTEGAEADAKSVQAQGLPMSASTPFPAMCALVSALPDIIAKVAEAKGVPVPAPIAQLPTDDLAGKFAPAHLTRRDPVWPPFSGGNCLPVGSGGRAASAKGTGLHLHTHHEGGVPDRSGVSPSSCSGARSITTRLTDRSHQCAAQVASATNNTAFLAYAISKKAREMELPLEDVEEFCNLADTILNLCAASAVCSSRIAAWQTLLQRQMWLRLSSSIPEDFKRELLEGPISPDGL